MSHRYRRNATPLQEAADADTPPDRLLQLARSHDLNVGRAVLLNPVYSLLVLEDVNFETKLGWALGSAAYGFVNDQTYGHEGPYVEMACRFYSAVPPRVRMAMGFDFHSVPEAPGIRAFQAIHMNRCAHDIVPKAWALLSAGFASVKKPEVVRLRKGIASVLRDVAKAQSQPDQRAEALAWRQGGGALVTDKSMPKNPVLVCAGLMMMEHTDNMNGGRPFGEVYQLTRRVFGVTGNSTRQDCDYEATAASIAFWMDITPKIQRLVKKWC